jgi:hypothetical protein
VRIRAVPLIVLLAAIVAIVGGWYMFAKTESGRIEATRAIQASRSEIAVGLDIAHDNGPIAHEAYRMSDNDGISRVQYTGTGRSGAAYRVIEPARATKDPTTNVAVLFGELQQDGIWDLGNAPARGEKSVAYTVTVSQTVNGQHGAHTFTFTDPHYWATTGGQQYHIKLDKNKPVPDLVQLKSTAIAEPRYGRIVSDFLDFGSPAFRSAVAAQQRKLRQHP